MNSEESDDYISDQGICYELVTINDFTCSIIDSKYLLFVLFVDFIIGGNINRK